MRLKTNAKTHMKTLEKAIAKHMQYPDETLKYMCEIYAISK
jgi:hypothetical protein